MSKHKPAFLITTWIVYNTSLITLLKLNATHGGSHSPWNLHHRKPIRPTASPKLVKSGSERSYALDLEPPPAALPNRLITSALLLLDLPSLSSTLRCIPTEINCVWRAVDSATCSCLLIRVRGRLHTVSRHQDLSTYIRVYNMTDGLGRDELVVVVVVVVSRRTPRPTATRRVRWVWLFCMTRSGRRTWTPPPPVEPGRLVYMTGSGI